MERNGIIDIAKYVAAILVVAIHTHPFVNISEELDFFFVEIICRLAVPFFAVCTGFYLTRAIRISEKGMGLVCKSLSKVTKMYFGWSMLYLLIHLCDWYRNDTLCQEYVVGWCKSLFVSSSYYHLWYLTALIYALPLFGLIQKLVPPKYYLLLAIPLWSYKAVSYGYFAFIPRWSQFLFTIKMPIEALKTGIIFMLPLLLLGAWLAHHDINRWRLKNVSVISIFIFGLLMMEVYHLREIGGMRYSFIFSTYPLAMAFFAVLYLMGCRKAIVSGQLAKTSMIVYCLHPAVIWLLKNWTNNNLVLFLLAALISTTLCVVWLRLKHVVGQ